MNMSLGIGNGETTCQKLNSQFSLSLKEKEYIEKFLSSIGASSSIADNVAQAFRFLAARKFNVHDAIELYHSYEAFLKSEGITLINPFEECVRQELLSGKFTILNDNDPAGARVAQLFVRLHRPTKSTHKAFLQSIIFQLHAALRKETAVRNGIILIYDMTNSKYSNFDADLSKKLFNMLKSCYPIRLRRIIVLTAPLWFRAPFQLLRVFIKEELRDRVHVLRPSPGSRLASLSNPDPTVAKRDHLAWLNAAITETAPFTTVNSSELFCSSNLGLFAPSLPSIIATFFDTSSSNETDSCTNTLDRSDRSSSSASDPGGDADAGGVSLGDDDSLMAEIGCCSPNWDPFALSSSQSSDAESVNNDGSLEGSSRRNVMSMSCSPALSAANIAVASAANGDISNDKLRSAKTVTEGTPTPPAKPKFPSSCLLSDNSPSNNDLASATTSTLDSHTSALVGRGVKSRSGGVLHNYFIFSPAPNGKNAPLASHDDFNSLIVTTAVEDSNTIRKEKRSKQGANSSTSLSSTSSHSLDPKSSLLPSDLMPYWAMDRPSGPSIHEGPDITCPTSTALSSHLHSLEGNVSHSVSPNDSQLEKSVCGGEPSPASAASSPTSLLRSRILQSPNATSPVDDLAKSLVDNHHDQKDSNHLETENVEQAMEVDYEQEEEEENYEHDDDDVSGSQSEASDSGDDGDESMDLDLDSLWMTPDELVNHVANVGVNGLYDEYAAVGSVKTNDPCTAFRRPCNSSKNRYVDVTCLERSRVQLRAHQQNTAATTPKAASASGGSGKAEARTDKQGPIYIHANWVDSYRQRNAFICTQGPLQETAGDFWFMMWTYNVPAIVMITRCYESQRSKCFQYWPTIEGQSLRFTTISPSASPVVTAGCSGWGAIGATGGPGNSGTMAPNKKKTLYGLARRSASEVSNSNKFVFEVTYLSSQPGVDYTCTKLQLKDVKSGQNRIVEHYAFHSWPDHGVPTDSSALLELLSTVQNEYASTIKRELGYTSFYDTPIPPPPIVVHCSAGIGRTGTFIALDVSTKQLVELGKVNVPLTVTRIRSQRSGCVQVSAQYLFVYRALIDFALSRGLISPAASNVAAVAQRQLSASTRPAMPSVGPTGSLPMDASLLSVLAAAAASQRSGGGSTSSGSSSGDAAHFGALMRLVRGYMTSVRGSADSNTDVSSQQRVSTELDYETEGTQVVALAASEEDDAIESIDGSSDEGDSNPDDEPKLAEIPTEEEEERQAMQTEELAPQIPSSSPPSDIPQTTSNGNGEQQHQKVTVEKFTAF